MLKTTLAAIAMTAGAAHAQGLPELSDVMSEIEGREVTATGRVEMLNQYVFSIRPGSSARYLLQPALNRDQLAAMEQCAASDGCMATVKAELTWQDSSLRLIVFDITVH